MKPTGSSQAPTCSGALISTQGIRAICRRPLGPVSASEGWRPRPRPRTAVRRDQLDPEGDKRRRGQSQDGDRNTNLFGEAVAIIAGSLTGNEVPALSDCCVKNNKRKHFPTSAGRYQLHGPRGQDGAGRGRRVPPSPQQMMRSTRAWASCWQKRCRFSSRAEPARSSWTSPIFWSPP